MKIDSEDEVNLAKHVSSGKFTRGSALPESKGRGKKGGVLALEDKKSGKKGGVLALEDKKSNSNVLALEDKKPVNTTEALQQLQMVLAESREVQAVNKEAASPDDIDLDVGEEKKAEVSWDALYNFVFKDAGEQKGYDQLLKNHDLCLNDGNLSLVPKKIHQSRICYCK
jgi:hypothetical protein